MKGVYACSSQLLAEGPKNSLSKKMNVTGPMDDYVVRGNEIGTHESSQETISHSSPPSKAAPRGHDGATPESEKPFVGALEDDDWGLSKALFEKKFKGKGSKEKLVKILMHYSLPYKKNMLIDNIRKDVWRMIMEYQQFSDVPKQANRITAASATAASATAASATAASATAASATAASATAASPAAESPAASSAEPQERELPDANKNFDPYPSEFGIYIGDIPRMLRVAEDSMKVAGVTTRSRRAELKKGTTEAKPEVVKIYWGGTSHTVHEWNNKVEQWEDFYLPIRTNGTGRGDGDLSRFRTGCWDDMIPVWTVASRGGATTRSQTRLPSWFCNQFKIDMWGNVVTRDVRICTDPPAIALLF